MAEAAGTYVPTPEEREEFSKRLAEAEQSEAMVPVTQINGKNIIWQPHDGSQHKFMECRLLEALYHGTRGPGKTDALLMSFAQIVGRGHGAAWRGIIFRQTYPQLADIQAKSEKWFRLMFPEARFNRSKMMWEWPTGEVLMFRHIQRPSDYYNYHGHEYPFIGFEELCNWADPKCFTLMFACCRTSTPGVPRMIRATTNPYGPGHSWVKNRYRLDGRWWEHIVQLSPKSETGALEPARAAIYGHIDENTHLLEANPDYKQSIAAAADGLAMEQAWQHGSWDIVAGGMFGDVWNPAYNIVPPFVPPLSWRVDRSFDWGDSAPFSVGWWAESDGSDFMIPDRGVLSSVRGDLFRIKEWYGWTGRPNQGTHMLASEIAEGIVERELLWKLHGRVKPGPADSSIFDIENGVQIALDMGKPVRIGNMVHKGVTWGRADKRSGSRKVGWQAMRKMMRAAHPRKGLPREAPGLFVTQDCDQFIRTVPPLPRKETDMDDVDSTTEDHIGDETRYRVTYVGQRAGQATHTGMF